MTKTFLGPKGFTSSKASHFANMAHELAEQDISDLQSMSLFSSVMRHTSGDIPILTESVNLEEAKRLVLNRARLYTLSAWLRSAVKYKEKITKDCETQIFVFDEQEPSRPKLLTAVDESWAIEQLTIKELADYLAAEATAAHIGKMIHPDGLISIWRKSIRGFAQLRWDREFPVLVSSDTNPEDVDSLFFGLQKLHRDAEQHLNYYRAKIQNSLNDENERIHGENAKLSSEYAVLATDYNNRRKTAEQEFLAAKQAERKRISQLRIVIPHELEPVVQFIEQKSGVSSTDGSES